MNTTSLLRCLGVAAVLGAAPLPAQALRCTGPVVSGGTMTIDVGSNDQSIRVVNCFNGASSTHAVGPGKRVTIPVPPVLPGTILCIVAGRGLNAHVIAVEVIAP
jgi:hypothetical protein